MAKVIRYRYAVASGMPIVYLAFENGEEDSFDPLDQKPLHYGNAVVGMGVRSEVPDVLRRFRGLYGSTWTAKGQWVDDPVIVAIAREARELAMRDEWTAGEHSAERFYS